VEVQEKFNRSSQRSQSGIAATKDLKIHAKTLPATLRVALARIATRSVAGWDAGVAQRRKEKRYKKSSRYLSICQGSSTRQFYGALIQFFVAFVIFCENPFIFADYGLTANGEP
jgi:hypothetical protein